MKDTPMTPPPARQHDEPRDDVNGSADDPGDWPASLDQVNA
jgi:hypothetical protein